MLEYPKYVADVWIEDGPELVGTMTFNSWNDAEAWCIQSMRDGLVIDPLDTTCTVVLPARRIHEFCIKKVNE